MLTSLLTRIPKTGHGFSWNHPRHDYMHLLGKRSSIWSLPPLRLRAQSATSPGVLLCRREPHFPKGSRILRCGDCDQVLWRFYQVRPTYTLLFVATN